MSDGLLIIEDEALLARELQRRFEKAGFEVTLVNTLALAEDALGSDSMRPLVVLSDMNLPDGNALDLLERQRAGGATHEWIVLTGYGTVADTVRGLRLGAFDFLEKPADPERLDLAIQGAFRSSRAQRRLAELVSDRAGRFRVEAFLGRSPAAAATRDLLARLARVPFSAVLLGGETGTGKGLAARILHHAGPRAAAPLVELNCAALPHDLLESELFGHEAGAFTGAKGLRRGLIEQADGGTLFLDEIGEMAVDLQSKLLKVLEDRRVRRLGGTRELTVDLRVVAASNRDLEEQVRRGAFRPDLYHRLCAFAVTLPPLRDRREDLRDMVPAFVQEFSRLVGRSPMALPDALWVALDSQAWPGNIREVRNVIERCVLLAEGDDFPMHLLPANPRTRSGAAINAGGALAESAPLPDGASATPPGIRQIHFTLDGSRSLDQMECDLILAALDASGGNLKAAARLLQTTRETLRYRVQKFGLVLGNDPV